MFSNLDLRLDVLERELGKTEMSSLTIISSIKNTIKYEYLENTLSLQRINCHTLFESATKSNWMLFLNFRNMLILEKFICSFKSHTTVLGEMKHSVISLILWLLYNLKSNLFWRFALLLRVRPHSRAAHSRPVDQTSRGTHSHHHQHNRSDFASVFP